VTDHLERRGLLARTLNPRDRRVQAAFAALEQAGSRAVAGYHRVLDALRQAAR
jgi:hypothetical protein